MNRQYQTRTFSQASSSVKKQPRFSPPPVIQAKAAKKPKKDLPEWKPGGSGMPSLLEKLRDTAKMQAKLAIGEPNDKYEQEADRVARDVVQHINSSVTNTVQQEAIAKQKTKEEDELQMKPMWQGGGEALSKEGETPVTKHVLMGGWGNPGYATTDDDYTTLKSDGFEGGCVGVILLGPGNTRTLAHIDSEHVFMNPKTWTNLEAFRNLATAANTAHIYYLPPYWEKDDKNYQKFIADFGLARLNIVRHGKPPIISVDPESNVTE